MRHFLQHAALAAVALLLTSVAVRAEPVTYTMDPGHTDIVATWSHFGFSKPSAMFDQVTGTLTYDPEHPEKSSVQVTIPVSSIHTSSEKLDEHLKAGDFFEAKKWPDIRFKSTKVVKGATPETLKVTGDLSMHGVTKPVTLDVTVNKLGTRHDAKAAGFNATASLKRSDFGIGLYAPMVSDQIDLRMTTEAIESQAWDAMQSKKK